MFEIRIICKPADRERVSKALSAAFDVGAVREYAARDGKRSRLYVTADHHPGTGPWPTPEDAYTLAPSITSEIGWTAHTAARKPLGDHLPREYWLRKAAVLDRIALEDEHSDAAQAAIEAGHRLMRLDSSNAACDPRGYVRQQYADFIRTSSESE